MIKYKKLEKVIHSIRHLLDEFDIFTCIYQKAKTWGNK